MAPAVYVDIPSDPIAAVTGEAVLTVALFR